MKIVHRKLMEIAISQLPVPYEPDQYGTKQKEKPVEVGMGLNEIRKLLKIRVK